MDLLCSAEWPAIRQVFKRSYKESKKKSRTIRKKTVPMCALYLLFVKQKVSLQVKDEGFCRHGHREKKSCNTVLFEEKFEHVF